MEIYTVILPEMQVKIKEGMSLEEVEEVLKKQAFEQCRTALARSLEEREEVLFSSKAENLCSEGYRRRYITTIFGTILYERRLYRDKKGERKKYCYLLDEALKIEPDQRVSKSLFKMALESADRDSYREVEKEIEKRTGERISHETCRQWVLKATDEIRKREKKMWEEECLCEEKEIVFCEVDGCHVPLQREATRSAEVKVGVFYDGREPRYSRGKGYKLKNKHIYAGLEKADVFREKLTLFGEIKAGVSNANHIFISSDGANWVDGLKEDYPEAIFHLDWYHINRNIIKNLPGDKKFGKRIYGLIKEGKASDAIGELQKKHAEIKDVWKGAKIVQLKKYLENHLDEIYGFKKIPSELASKYYVPKGTGGIEGNIGALFKQRIKGRGMSWSRKGLNAIVKLKTCIMSGELDEIIYHHEEGFNVELKEIKRILPEGVRQNYRVQEKLQMDVPVLHGSMYYAPAIRQLVYGREGILQ